VSSEECRKKSARHQIESVADRCKMRRTRCDESRGGGHEEEAQARHVQALRREIRRTRHTLPLLRHAKSHALGSGVSGSDRIVGLVLIVIGALLLIPALWFFYWALRYGRLRAKAAAFMIPVIPLGAIFNGILLVNGVHPKDFYSWWNNLSDLVRWAIYGALALIAAVVVIAFMFGGSGDVDVGDMDPDMMQPDM
jgi:hypothetical protein